MSNTPTMNLVHLGILLLAHFKKAAIAMEGLRAEEREYPGTIPTWLVVLKAHLTRCLELVEQIEQEMK